MRVTLTVWLLLASVLTVLAEQPSPKKTEKSAKAPDPIPAYQISFKAVDECRVSRFQVSWRVASQ